MPRISVPTIKWPYCSRRVLVMEWIDGVKLTDIEVGMAFHDRFRVITGSLNL